ncbi:MAG TPA: hypothetical protein VJ124_14545 [Pyrinomonadaceae bacterium]|nr:hypothetical protein [Pyrinomonadaceae bacterium]
MVAFLQQREIFQPQADKPFPYLTGGLPGRFSLSVVSQGGPALLPPEAAHYDLLPFSVRWSPNGKELAFVAFPRGTDKPQLVRVLMASRSLRVSPIETLNPNPDPRQAPELEWTQQGWILYASRRMEGARSRA